jgi:polyisoprenoid-binding protein YceI
MSSTATQELSRSVDGIELPAPGTFALDPSHTTIGFTVRHLMVSKVRGRFGSFTGSVVVADNPLESSVDVNIDTASIDTRDEQRDGHLRSPDFFDVEQHPSATFTSRAVKAAAPGRYTLDGDLTILGVTKPVRLDVTLDGVVQDPWGNQRIGLSATTEIDRDEWGLSWNQALETGGFLLGKKIRIDIDAEAVRQ